MSLIHSETEAALLEASRLSRQLGSRYRHAIEHLLEAGEIRDAFNARADTLENQAEELDELTRARDLLPRDANTELNDLHKIADQLSGWLDADQARALAVRFAEDEQCLLGELETASREKTLATPLNPMLEACRKTIDDLGIP
jgi:hypothetical protein